MIKPETNDFFGNELDKAKLEIASYWKDKYEKTQKALDVAVDALNKIINAQGQCWGATDTEIKFDCKHYAHEALEQITTLEQKDVK